MVQLNEVVNLGLVLVLLPLLYVNGRRVPVPQRKSFTIAVAFMILGWVTTILEGFFLPDLLNLVEHVCYATGGILFAYGLYSSLHASDMYGSGRS